MQVIRPLGGVPRPEEGRKHAVKDQAIFVQVVLKCANRGNFLYMDKALAKVDVAFEMAPLPGYRPDASGDHLQDFDIGLFVLGYLVSNAYQQADKAIILYRHSEMPVQRGVSIRQAALIALSCVVIVNAWQPSSCRISPDAG